MDYPCNFDIYGGLTFDEWLEQEDEEKENTTPERHVACSEQELFNFEKSRNEASTAKSTTWAVNCFRDYLQSKKQDVDFATISKEHLNSILREFYGSVSSQRCSGRDYFLSLRNLVKHTS